jgi:hypothetical protein
LLTELTKFGRVLGAGHSNTLKNQSVFLTLSWPIGYVSIHFNSNPTLALNTDSHHKCLGFALVSPKIIEEFEKKLARFPNLKNRTIHKVLITTEGADDPLTDYGYFDRVITLRDMFDAG